MLLVAAATVLALGIGALVLWIVLRSPVTNRRKGISCFYSDCVVFTHLDKKSKGKITCTLPSFILTLALVCAATSVMKGKVVYMQHIRWCRTTSGRCCIGTTE
jgi:hypothetical protein